MIDGGTPYRKENNLDEVYLHRSNSTQSVNWKGRLPKPAPDSIAGQIMFLPTEPELERQAWDPEGNPMHKDGYGHPVLILTNQDHEGFVVVQKASIPFNALKASYMQIDDGERVDPDATTVLRLYNDHNIRPIYLKKRSFVETRTSYKCPLNILQPYDKFGKPLHVDLESLDLAIVRVLFARFKPPNKDENHNHVFHLNSYTHIKAASTSPPRKPHLGQKPLQLAQPEHLGQPEQPAEPAPSHKIRDSILKSFHMDRLLATSRKDKDVESSEKEDMAKQAGGPSKLVKQFMRSARRTPISWSAPP
ncbi:hypothetical protein QBC32DRAFT_374233 [Pseudoneurospora amorphoporcata]|uniref:Uncharacterized protein n=1 Tax=Pseudoneurospora amorphoporcata TaxID=241081 RepID=A0AAN6NKH6_9PEZI|nr:hypothetical protein QBC32DRAFT_374233 [Pseudoneurospora amorphoporcata]